MRQQPRGTRQPAPSGAARRAARGTSRQNLAERHSPTVRNIFVFDLSPCVVEGPHIRSVPHLCTKSTRNDIAHCAQHLGSAPSNRVKQPNIFPSHCAQHLGSAPSNRVKQSNTLPLYCAQHLSSAPANATGAARRPARETSRQFSFLQSKSTQPHFPRTVRNISMEPLQSAMNEPIATT